MSLRVSLDQKSSARPGRQELPRLAHVSAH